MSLLTIIKLYPIHNSLQPFGHSGIATDWLCTAITLVGASHTEHLSNYKIIYLFLLMLLFLYNDY